MSEFKAPESSNIEVSAIQADVKSELPTSNPYLKDGFLRAQSTGLGRRIYALYFQMNNWLKQFFPNTSRGQFQKMWMQTRNIQPISASKATGNIAVTGTVGHVIASGNILKVGDVEYRTVGDSTITVNVLNVTNLIFFITNGICQTDGPHHLADGMTITIDGVTNDTSWNRTFSNIMVTTEDIFQFTAPASLASPAIGTITCTSASANTTVESTARSLSSNQSEGVSMTFESEIAGVDGNAVVQFLGISGGADAETEEQIAERLGETFAFPITLNNGNHIKKIIRNIPSNTRVWVHYAYPAAGEVTAFFVCDNRDVIIPTATDEALALAAVQASYTAHTDPDDIHIGGPTGRPVSVVVSGVLPSTASMRTAVENKIKSYYSSRTNEGVDDYTDSLRSFIWQTYDPNAGEAIQGFTLESPVIQYQTIALGEISVLGSLVVT